MKNYTVYFKKDTELEFVTIYSVYLRTDEFGVYFMDKQDHIFAFVPHGSLSIVMEIKLEDNKSKDIL